MYRKEVLLIKALKDLYTYNISETIDLVLS
jgi:hypothetical protein